MYKNIAIAAACSFVMAVSAGSASAQTWSALNTNYNAGGTANLSHTLALSCTVSSGNLWIEVGSSASSVADVNGVTNPFGGSSSCDSVLAQDYKWKAQINSVASTSPRVFNVTLIGVSAKTIIGSKCKGNLTGTFNDDTDTFVASGTIPVVSGLPLPANCSVSVNLKIPNLNVVP